MGPWASQLSNVECPPSVRKTTANPQQSPTSTSSISPDQRPISCALNNFQSRGGSSGSTSPIGQSSGRKSIASRGLREFAAGRGSQSRRQVRTLAAVEGRAWRVSHGIMDGIPCSSRTLPRTRLTARRVVPSVRATLGLRLAGLGPSSEIGRRRSAGGDDLPLGPSIPRHAQIGRAVLAACNPERLARSRWP